MHRHEYEFWLRKYDLDGFSAGAWEIKRAASEPIDKARAGIDRHQSSIYKKEVDEVWTLRSVLLLILGC